MNDDLFPWVHFGQVLQDRIDWRQAPDTEDVDDMLLFRTPSDVVQMLGFDPLELA